LSGPYGFGASVGEQYNPILRHFRNEQTLGCDLGALRVIGGLIDNFFRREVLGRWLAKQRGWRNREQSYR
jgi:hypothetical protein